MLHERPLFVAGTHVNSVQTPVTLAQNFMAAARHVRRFGVKPQIPLYSGDWFGDNDGLSGRVMRVPRRSAARRRIWGQIHAYAAFDPELRERLLPDNRLTGKANVLVYVNTDAAEAARNLLTSAAGRIGRLKLRLVRNSTLAFAPVLLEGGCLLMGG